VSGRDQILEAVRAALHGRRRTDHPGSFEGWRPGSPAPSDLEAFTNILSASGAEVVLRRTVADGAAWLAAFSEGFDGVTVGTTVPADLRPRARATAPDVAQLGVSLALGAVAETGSLLMDARDGRRSQLLAPTHVVFVHASDLYATLREALLATRTDLPSAIGLHSGPSKSQDIGHVMVTGVHGPGRLIAVVLGA
jgi:L-lactate dehydrogenase complex protein LldG